MRTRRFGRRKSDKFVWAVAILAVVALYATYTHGCNKGESPTAPQVTQTEPAAAAPAATNTEQPAPAPTPTPFDGPAPEGSVDPDGTVTLKNVTHHEVNRDICYFKNGPHPQELLKVVSLKVAAGQTHQEPLPKFDLDCGETLRLQVDLVANDGCEGGSNNLKGLMAWNYPVIKAPACEEECREEWIEQEPVRENETDYGACEPGAPELLASTTTPPTVDCPGHRSRTVDIVVYEMEKCTQETRQKSRLNIEEQEPCTAQCEQSFCHTQNLQWKIWEPNYGKWQCQNVPPGTPGHWPHHFSMFPVHNDFFGPCTEEKCYRITN